MLLSCSLVLSIVDPYGDDCEDLSVTTYVESTLHMCKIIFTTKGSNLNKSVVVASQTGSGIHTSTFSKSDSKDSTYP